MTDAVRGWPFPGLVWGPYPQQPLPPSRAPRSRGGRPRAWTVAARAIARQEPLPDADPLHAGLARACAALRASLGVQPRWQQVLAARALLDQRLVEMATGEGKTFALALAAAVAAAQGTPVHVVTANDYLAQRDALALQPFFASLGLSCGFVRESTPADQRRQAYACNVTYCAARELVFDYLRDGLSGPLPASSLQARMGADAGAPAPRVLRGLCMALLDEADTLLIDDARTPFVLSRAVDHGEAAAFMRECWAIARACEPGRDFALGPARDVVLRPGAQVRLARWPAGAHPQYSHPLQREESLRLALAALHALRRDDDYVVRDGRIELVDATTGRASAGRAWSQGLHQFVELKEGISATPQTETAAQIVCQRFFARYLRLAGLSGTLSESRRELRRVYGLGVFAVPAHRPRAVEREPTLFFPDSPALFAAVAARAAVVAASGRPVLIGTGSVAESRAVARLLATAGVPHAVLHALADAEEARVIASAGEPGRITVATNMAGRGTDILLDAQAIAHGGLHVLLCQANASPRIDRQFLGRTGRQGQPGSTAQWLALDAPLLVRWLPGPLRRWLAARGPRPGVYLFLRWSQYRERCTQTRLRVTLCDWAEAQERDLAFSPDPLS